MSKQKPSNSHSKESGLDRCRKTYESPRLVEYGNLARLTRGNPTSGDDMMFAGSVTGT